MSQQTERLVELIRGLLSAPAPMDVTTLSEQLGVCSKTLRRDLDFLQQLGVGLQIKTVRHGRRLYSMDGRRSSGLGLTGEEALAVMLCLPNGSVFDGTPLGDAMLRAFRKLSQRFAPDQLQQVARALPQFHHQTANGDYSSLGDVIQTLRLAIERQLAVRLRYHSSGRPKPRSYTIQPYGLVEARGALYVVGHSAHHDQVRTWKVDRIRSTELTDERFERPADFSLERHFRGALTVVVGDRPVSALIRITGTAVRYVQEKRLHPSQRVELLEDGSALVRFELTSLLELKSWVLSFGESAEALEPDQLRREVADALRSAARLYRSSASQATG
jgi:predicted DNA-binding transcriptional regulator YafY